MRKGLVLMLCAGALFFSSGCSKEGDVAPHKEQSSGPNSPPMQSDNSMIPMMKEDPRSIRSVEGMIQEVDDRHLVVHTTKNVSLKFQRDGKTVTDPPNTKLAVGMNVKIKIEHLSVGMRAQTVKITK